MDHLTGPLLGGALIGLAAALLMAGNGRIAGISGILGGLVSPERGNFAWKAAFTGGLLGGGVLLRFVAPDAFGPVPVPPGAVVASGLLVGFGTRLANGCTSGHGVCGMARLSRRSLVATVIFIAVGMLCTLMVKHLVGGLS